MLNLQKKNEFISNVFLIFDDTVIDLRGGGGVLTVFTRTPISLNNIHTIVGFLAFSFKISEYCFSLIV